QRRHPDGVAGLVLVDSSSEDGWRTTPRAVQAEVRKLRARRAEQIRRWRETGAWEEMGFPDRTPRELVSLLAPRTRTAAWWDARFAESDLCDSFDALAPEERRISVPLAVLTASAFGKLPSLSEAVNSEWHRARF